MSERHDDSQNDQAPLASRVVRGGIGVALGSYFNTVFGFLANLFLTRNLIQEDFGVYSLAFFFFSLANLRQRTGIGYAFVQRKGTTGKLAGTHLILDVGLGLSTFVLLLIVAPLLPLLGYSKDVTWVLIALGGIGIVDSITTTAAGLLDKELHMGRTTLVSSLAFPISYLPAFWLATHDGRYWSVVAQVLTYAVLLCIGMWWTARKRLTQIWQVKWTFDRATAGELVRFGINVGFATLAGMMVAQFDNFLVGTFAGEKMLGYYDRAYRIAQWPSLLITSVLTRATFFAYIKLQDDPVRLRKTVTMTLWLTTVLALPIALGVFVSAPDLIAWFYTDRWLPSAIFLRFLIAYSLLRPLMDNAGMLFIAIGQPRKTTITAAVQAASLILLATPLTLIYGPIGTCIGVGLAFAIGLGFTYYYLYRVIALPLKEIVAAPLISTLVAILAYLFLARNIDFHAFPLAISVLLQAGVTALIFLCMMLLIQRRLFVERWVYVWNLAKQTKDQ